MDLVVVASDFNAALGYLMETERHIRGPFSVPAERTDNGGRLIQACSNRRLFLANTNLCHKPTSTYLGSPSSLQV